MKIIFVGGIGTPRIQSQKHLSRAWKQPNRIHSDSGIQPALSSSETQGRYLVLVIPKSTSTQSKSMKNTSQNTKTSEISPKSTNELFPTSTLSAADFLARHLVLLENVKDSPTLEELYFLTSHGYSRKNNLDCFYWKTSKDFYLMTAAELSKSSSPRLMSWGMTSNGRYSTARITESHRTEKESSLSVTEGELNDLMFFH